MGTTSGEPREVERFDDSYVAERLDEVDRRFIALYPCHTIAASVAAEVGFAGPNSMFPTACAAGNYAVAHACDVLRAGRADVMLAGGADSFSRITYTGFARLGAIAPERLPALRPRAQGDDPGRGGRRAGARAVRRAPPTRGARIYAEVAGYGLSCDAHHMTGAHPEGDGARRAMEQALAAAGLDAGAVSYVSAHGTGTPTNDRLESHRLPPRLRRGGAAGAGVVDQVDARPHHGRGVGHRGGGVRAGGAPTAWCRRPSTSSEPDPDCDLDVVPNEAREMPVAVAMNNAYAFGGNNASVLFRRVAAMSAAGGW